MKRLLTVLLALLVAGSLSAGVTTILSGVSAASGTSGVIDTSGARVINVQACGTGFTGTITAKQGATTSTLVATKTAALTTNSDCTTYWALLPSTYTEVTYTRTAGSLTVYLEYEQ
jgi:hypothetical protein